MTKSNMGFTIRHLNEEELPQLIDVWLRSGLPHRPKGRDNIEALRQQWRGAPESFVGAFSDGRLAGAALVTDDGRKGWINRLAILPEFRGRGIAKAIVKECERILNERGRLLYCVLIEADNPASERLFTQLGYKKENEIHYYTKRVDTEF